jgi:HK97 gp10 family phage protein
MKKNWTPEEWAAFVRGPLANAITPEVNRKALEAGLIEMDNGQKLRIEEKDIVDTGATLNSVNHKINRVDKNGGEGESGPGTHYAIYHEYGTHNYKKSLFGKKKSTGTRLKARPFMRPTIDEDQKQIQQAFAAPYTEVIKGLF